MNKKPMNVKVNCECCGKDMVKGLDEVTKANVCIKCRDVFFKLSTTDKELHTALEDEKKGEVVIGEAKTIDEVALEMAVQLIICENCPLRDRKLPNSVLHCVPNKASCDGELIKEFRKLAKEKLAKGSAKGHAQ